MKGVGLKQWVRSYTRCTKYSNTTIHLVFSNLSTATEVIEKPKITDDSIVKINLSHRLENAEQNCNLGKVHIRDYRNFYEKNFMKVFKKKWKWREKE